MSAAVLEGRVGFDPTTPGLEARDPFADPAPTTCRQSRRPPIGGRSLRTLFTSSRWWGGRRESNPCGLLGRNHLTPQNKANC
jgi:hypothetical protein